MTNFFEQLGDRQLVRPVKLRLARSERDAPMKPTAQEKAQLDRGIQTSLWRAAHRAELEAARAGSHGEALMFLDFELRRMTLDDGGWLVAFVENSPLRQAPADIRYLALAAIGNAIMRLRISNGYAPFDDSLPGEEPTAFEIIRSLLCTH